MAIGDVGEFTTLALGILEHAADPLDRAKLDYRAQKWLQTDGSLTVDSANANNGILSPNSATGQSPGLIFGSSDSEGIASKRTAGGNQNGLDFYTNSTARLSITNIGNIGIGITGLPTAKLEINGDLKLQTGVAINKFSNDNTLASNSDLNVPTEKAVKTYIDQSLSTRASLAGSTTQDFQTQNLKVTGVITTDPQKKLTVKGEVGISRLGVSFESSQDIEVNSATLQQLNAAIVQANQAVQAAQTAARNALTQTTQAKSSIGTALQLAMGLMSMIQALAAVRPWAMALLPPAMTLVGVMSQTPNLIDVAQTSVQSAINLQAPPDSLLSISKALQAIQSAQTVINQAGQLATQLVQQAGAQLPEVTSTAQQTNQAIQVAQSQINNAASTITQAQTAAQTAQTALNNPLLEIYAYGIGARQANSQVYDSYAFHRWCVRGIEKLRLEPDGNFYVGNPASESNAKLTIDDLTVDNTWNTAAFRKAAIGPNWSHIHYGSTGDWYIRSAANNGKVVIQDNSGSVQIGSGGTVQIGGNRSGAFVRFNDDLWFSDPQNGTIEIKNGVNNDWGTMVGRFNQPSSATYKQNISTLHTQDLEGLLEDTLNLKLVQFRYRGQNQNHRLSLGVIAEECPAYMVGDDGKSLSTTEYIAMLHGAIKVLATKLAVLEQQIARDPI